jgi:chemosensory pili system protein ChpA (sensor histidine kinase/response regulator)
LRRSLNSDWFARGGNEVSGLFYVDRGAFAWVATEIRDSLKNARAELEDRGRRAGGGLLGFASQLHQIAGTFKMVELDGGANLANEAEALASADNAVGADRDALLAETLGEIERNIAEIESGAADLPVRALPFINRLRAARGAPALDAWSFFEPDLSVYPPPAARRQLLSEEEFKTMARRARHEYQAQLLHWFRDGADTQALDRMQDIVDELRAHSRYNSSSQLWWIGSAFIEALRQHPTNADIEQKKLLGRLDLQIRASVRGGDAGIVRERNEELRKALLYQIGRQGNGLGKGVAARVREVQNAFQLRTLLTGEVPAPAEPAGIEDVGALAARARADLAEAQRRLAAYFDAEGEPDVNELQAALAGLEKLSALAREHGALRVQALVDRVSDLCREIAGAERAATENDSFEIASALMFLDETFGGGLPVDEDWGQLAKLRTDRLAALRLSAPHQGVAPPPDLSAPESQRLLAAVAGEIAADLGHVEEALEAYANGPEQPGVLDPAPRHLRQVHGALTMLFEHRAAELATLALKHIEGVAQGRAVADRRLLDALAVAVGSIGEYVKGLVAGRGGLHEMLARAIREIEEAASLRDLAAMDAGTLAGTVRDALAAWLADNANQAAFESVRHALRSLSAVAEYRDSERLKRIADEMYKLVDIVSDEPSFLSAGVRNTLQQSLAALLPLAAALPHGVPAAPAKPAPGVLETAPDEEMLEVFYTEVDELAPAMDQALARWSADPADREALIELRRQFHTIKGSGRTVGARGVAELSWIAEAALNAVIAGQREVTPALLLFLRSLHDDLAARLQRRETEVPEEVLARWQAERDALALTAVEASAAPVLRAKPVQAEAELPLAMDEELLAIYDNEAAGHLATIGEFLAQAGSDPRARAPSDALLRAVHTLRGASRSVGLLPVADAFARFEALLASRHERELPLGDTDLDLAAQLADAARRTLARLERRLAPTESLIDEFIALEARVQRARDETPEIVERAPAALEGAERATARPIREVVSPEVLHELTAPAVSTALPARPEEDLDLKLIFCDEAHELLGRMQSETEGLRGGAYGEKTLAALRRTLHTLKGGARTVGLDAIGDLSHMTESLLARPGATDAGRAPELSELIEEIHDALLDQVQRIEQREPPGDIAELASRVQRFDRPVTATIPAADSLPERSAVEVTAVPQEEHAPAPARSEEPEPATAPMEDAAPSAAAGRASVRVTADMLEHLTDFAGEASIARSRVQDQVASVKSHLGELRHNVSRFRQQLRDLEIEADSRIPARRDQPAGHAAQEFDPLELDRYTKLQELSRGLGESLDDLVSIQNGFHDFVGHVDTALQRQTHLSAELQDRLMRTRLVPFSSLFPRLRHQVRLVARELGKQAQLETIGGEVQIDRNVLEAMAEAFDHMVRNALDHGIEDPAARVAAGKPEAGRLRIVCRPEGNEITIEFSDDGAGLDPDRIRAKAREQGLRIGLRTTDVHLSDEELIQLIVLPGFSTAEHVTQISGRGVGMDVVHSALRRLGGSIGIENRPGSGVSFKLRLPVSTAITRALLVRAGEEQYAVPFGAIRLVIKAPAADLERDAEGLWIEHGRERLPVMDLAERLGAPRLEAGRSQVVLLLVRMGTRDIAVRVDAVVANQEVVVKSLGEHLADVRGIAGATIMGDGRVIPVLDIAELWLSHELHAAREPAAPEVPPVEVAAAPRGGPASVMVVDDSLTVRKVSARSLSRAGFEVMAAKDGIEALEQLAQHRPDLMLVDIEMPRMDGYDLIRELRSDSRYRDIPVIVVTSRAGEKHREKAFALGANDYLSKPYQEEELLARIHQLLDRAGTVIH